MKTLEACYEAEFNKINFYERKTRITHPKTILIGPPKCGKSYLIYDYLSNFDTKEYLYIDLSDLRNEKEKISVNLFAFVKEKNIKVLVLENYEFDFKFPICDSVVLTTKTDNSLKGFKKLSLNALDFEEFLLHDNRHQNITNSFNHFLKYGNLPGVILVEEHRKTKTIQELLRDFASGATELETLLLLFQSIDEKKSVFQLFTALKNKIKISKDTFYALCKEYEKNHMIFFIEKYNQPKAIKKIYSYNHGFLSAISYTKKFKNEFTNMVFLELNNKSKSIYYLDGIDFYLHNEKAIIFCIPFFNDLLATSIKKRISTLLKEIEIKEATIITIGNTQNFVVENLKVQVLPFYEWSLA
ncbi:MAG: ATP-binding protein [Candidatus Marinarcus sp.]|uniref:ATP-binding protein n=1 Tax=Candidatus Marinarcus sp. TaxID=3100987 RepID=UPI003AFFC127